LKDLDERLGVSKFLILTVTENGFGKRTDIDEYRLTARAAQGVNNLKASSKVGRSASILLVDETSELMVISQFGKIIRIDTKTIRAAGRATQGVRLLNLDADDKVAAAVIIPPEELKEDEPTLLQ
jgi:DNA gyrase subunit A